MQQQACPHGGDVGRAGVKPGKEAEDGGSRVWARSQDGHMRRRARSKSDLPGRAHLPSLSWPLFTCAACSAVNPPVPQCNPPAASVHLAAAAATCLQLPDRVEHEAERAPLVSIKSQPRPVAAARLLRQQARRPLLNQCLHQLQL